MPDSAPPGVVNPDDLMASVKRRSFLTIVLLSVGAHLIVVFGTSIGYLRLMRRYNSWHPRAEMKRLAKEKREQEAEARKKAAHEKFVAERDKRQVEPKGGTEKPSSATKAGAEEPKLLKDLKATSTERPKESSLKLDELELP